LLGGSWKLFIGVFETPGDEMKKFTLIAMLLAVLGIFSFSPFLRLLGQRPMCQRAHSPIHG
jgi:hypothetical protein